MQKPLLFKLVGCALFLALCSCVCFAGVFVLATRTNTNIPVVSDLAEKAENMFVSEENFKQQVVNDLQKYIQNPDLKESTNSIKSNLSFKINSNLQGQEFELSAKGSLEANYDGTELISDLDLNLGIADVKVDSNFDLKFMEKSGLSEFFVKFEEIPAFLSFVIPGVEEYSNKWLYLSDKAATNSLEEFNNNPQLKSDLSEFINTQEFKNLFSRSKERVFGNTRTRCIAINIDENKLAAAINKYESITSTEANEFTTTDKFTLTGEYCVGKGDGEMYYLDLNLRSDIAVAELTWDNIQYSNTKLNVQKPTMYIDLTEQLPMPTP